MKTILVCRPNNRLGNQLLITPIVQEITRIFPDCRIDLLVKGRISFQLFKRYERVGSIIWLPRKHARHFYRYLQTLVALKAHRYDMVINVDPQSSTGRILTGLTNARYKVFGDEQSAESSSRYPDYAHMAKRPVYNFRDYLEKIGIVVENRPPLPLSLELDGGELANGLALLKKFADPAKKVICLFTNATGEKCYSEEWWLAFYQQLKTRFPDADIVEALPAENISKIAFKAPAYYSRDLRELCAFIANTDVFIAADSGVMHLGAASGTPTIGLFKITDRRMYEPYNEGSVAIDTKETEVAQILTTIEKIIG